MLESLCIVYDPVSFNKNLVLLFNTNVQYKVSLKMRGIKSLFVSVLCIYML